MVAGAGPLPDVAGGERQARAGVGRGLGQHRRRTVHADHLGHAEPLGGQGGQLAGTTAEVGGSADAVGSRLHEVQQVEERLAALGGEAVVLIGVPGILTHTCILLVCISLSSPGSPGVTGGSFRLT